MPRYTIDHKQHHHVKTRHADALIDLHSQTFNADRSTVRVRSFDITNQGNWGGYDYKSAPSGTFSRSSNSITADIDFTGSAKEWTEYCFQIVKIFREHFKIRTIILPSRPDLEFNITNLKGTPLERVKIKRKGKATKRCWADEVDPSEAQYAISQAKDDQILDPELPEPQEGSKKKKAKEKKASKAANSKQPEAQLLSKAHRASQDAQASHEGHEEE
ncbi:hypothetical protein BJ875DRAFT_514168 [Amylocarpus encephaloides]|uniref:Uncharacterized protein n=1 Tax=Amylocarpus encephaloides TaxID=45428 RepID=A0A9P8C3J8_9HELO|nr:hypothetical protein BJ875DRAFT_514168 [Amylocarpus encephaloides]